MAFIHNEMNVMYRDLKPENILVTSKGYIKVTDFGLAKKYDNDNDLTISFVGTPEYIAPELLYMKLNNTKGYSRAVDLWTLGIFLYEILVGHTPFADP